MAKLTLQFRWLSSFLISLMADIGRVAGFRCHNDDVFCVVAISSDKSRGLIGN